LKNLKAEVLRMSNSGVGILAYDDILTGDEEK
jgi:hypothetical protein